MPNSIFIRESNQIQTRRVRVTDAQIRALIASPVEIILAPGIGKFIELLQQIILTNTLGGAYTLNGTSNFRVRYPSVTADSSFSISGVLDAAEEDVMYNIGSRSITLRSSVENAPIRLESLGPGELTGGNTANYIDVILRYTIWDI